MTDTEVVETERTRVGFPEAPAEEPRKFNFLALAIVLLVLLLIGGGVWYMFFRSPDEELIMEEDAVPTAVAEVTEAPSPTLAAVNKADIKIQVLNGSGVPGSAGKAKSALEAVGYSGIETGNADSYTYKTTVAAFGDNVPETVKTEITSELEKLYGKIDTKPNTVTQYDVVITIGYPKGFTPSVTGKPSGASVTPTKAATTGTGTTTPTGRLSTTVTVTPTP